MKPSSAKGKGRRLQNYLVGQIREWFTFPEEDVKGAIMGENGVDIKMSSAALKVLPFSFECKNVEALNIWSAIKQASSNMTQNTIPAVVFKRNHTKVYITMELDDFMLLAHAYADTGKSFRELIQLRANSTGEPK